MFVFLAEKQFLDPEYVLSALAASNPVVRGFLVERIVLAAISVNGLDGVAVSHVQHFNNPSVLDAHFQSLSLRNVLYVPSRFNYAKLDAVLVSNRFEPADPELRRSRKAVPTGSAGMVAVPTKPRMKRNAKPPVLKSIHVQFIQIKTGSLKADDLANTRSLLQTDAPEMKLWSRAAYNTGVAVTFGLHWIVPGAEIRFIQSSCADSELAGPEKASSLKSMYCLLE